jgi:5-methylcytosine-specific restriction endonuclease McrA
MSAPHPFSTRRGREFRNAILIRDMWTCTMCGSLLTQGRTDPRSAVVDHIRPIDLRPDLTWDEGNCRAICRDCHAVCDGIEKRHRPDAEAIAKAKQAWRRGTVDPYASW